MSPAVIALLVAVGVVVLVGLVAGLWAVAVYNGLVKSRAGVERAWADIETVLKRRHDLIPNLVETVKGYATHEKETLENVIAARNGAVAATGSSGVSDSIAAEGALSGTLRQLFAVAEAYPDLKANDNFRQLQDELGDTEDQIARQRTGYNRQVEAHNVRVESFPTNVIAGMFGFKAGEFFETESAVEREAPKVQF